MASDADRAGEAAGRLSRPIDVEGRLDRVAVEEPLEIRVGGEAVAVVMRTPGDDEELALGFLHGEGLLEPSGWEVGPPDDLAANTIDVTAGARLPDSRRRFYATSSCGVCGKGAIEELGVIGPPVGEGPTMLRDVLASLPERLRQPAFDLTGGLHAAGIFDAEGKLLAAREDVGRHNALDKAIGWALREGLLGLSGAAIAVSGRLAFELVQKAAVAGCPILVGVGAPTSLAIELARERGMTLLGFAREGSVNVYCGEERVASAHG